MKTRSKYGYMSAALAVGVAVAAVLTFVGCKKRPYTRIARLPLQVELDWSAVEGSGDKIPATLKLYLFREDGTLQAQYDIPKEGQVLGLLDVGTYKAICVNVNDYVEVLNSNKYETTQMVAKPASSSYLSGGLSKAEGNTVIYQPGWIFSSSIPEIRVGDPAITDDANTVSTVVFPMERRVKTVNFRFTVSGLTDEIEEVKGTLDNVAAMVELSSGEIVCGHEAASPFRLEYQADGTLGGTMLIFGNEADENPDLRNDLHLQFETESGRMITLHEDITEQMKEESVEGELNINIEANLDVRLNAGFVTIVITWKPGASEDIEGQ